tara:strand:- start:69 stop:257 length:189 start_codon:yes stop_codon:yes gene_type:complete
MKYEDIAGMQAADLKLKERELKTDLFNLKMKNALGQLGNPLEIRYLRKDIARVKTALRQKQG